MHQLCSKASGFTLNELIITLTIAGILTAIAVPTFNGVISNNRLTAYSNEFVTALNLARSEAIKRGTQVTVLRKGVVDNAWETGWGVLVDFDGNKLLNDDGDSDLCEAPGGMAAEDCLLRTYSELPAGFTLRSNNSLAKAISFNAMGKSSLAGTLILCDTNRADDPDPHKNDRLKSAKVIIITTTGRVRMGIDSDGDGVPNRLTGLNIEKCTL